MCTWNSNLNSQINTSQLPQERKSHLQIYTGCFCLKFSQLPSFFVTCPPDSTTATHSWLEAAYCKLSGSINIPSQSFHKRIRIFIPIFQILPVTWQNGISLFLNILNSDIKMETHCQLSCALQRHFFVCVWWSFCLLS